MKCQICDALATVHVSETVKNTKRELHLCERCARERNLIPEPPGPQIDLKALLKLLMHPFPSTGTPDEAVPEPAACELCGFTQAEFKASGRLGCPHDYEMLRETLEPLLERIHRAVEHTGKVPRVTRVAGWKRQMQKAIAAEEYEEAARLRDLIRQAEG